MSRWQTLGINPDPFLKPMLLTAVPASRVLQTLFWLNGLLNLILVKVNKRDRETDYF